MEEESRRDKTVVQSPVEPLQRDPAAGKKRPWVKPALEIHDVLSETGMGGGTGPDAFSGS